MIKAMATKVKIPKSIRKNHIVIVAASYDPGSHCYDGGFIIECIGCEVELTHSDQSARVDDLAKVARIHHIAIVTGQEPEPFDLP